MNDKIEDNPDENIIDFEYTSPANQRMILLETLANTIQKLDYKYQKGRIQDIKKEKTKTDQARAIIYGINVANGVLKDFELSEVLHTLNEIKTNINSNEAISLEDNADKLDVVEKTLQLWDD